MSDFREKKILVIAAHPDDELLGLGATMHKLIRKYKCVVHAVILGEGITSRSDKRSTSKWRKELSIHKENIESARKIIGYTSVVTYDFPDNRFDSVDLLDIIKVIEREKIHFQPEIIFTHHCGDLNIDHQRTFEAVMTAVRPLEAECVKTVISFETPSSTEWQAHHHPNPFLPNLFLEVGETDLKAKIAAMRCYEYERRGYPHPRSPEALEILAKRWGTVIGRKYAEAFFLVREIK